MYQIKKYIIIYIMEEVMNILFLGGDKRYRYMMSELAHKHSVYQIGFNNIEYVKDLNITNVNLSDFDIVIFPISGLNDNQEIKSEQGLINLPDTIFSNLNKRTFFYTGVKTKKLLEIIPAKQLISFLDYDEVQNINNSLTVDRSYG